MSTEREDVPFDDVDDGGLIYNVQRAKNGVLTAEVRIYGHLKVDGKSYSLDRSYRVRLKKEED